jgi:riboflavin transporter FmnP
MESKTKRVVNIAIFGVLSFFIMFFEINLPFMPFFLKLDISDTVPLIVGFIYNPIIAIGIILIKNLLRLLISSNLGIGELSNFLIGASLVGSSSYLYNNHNLSILKSLIIGSFVMTITAVIVNLIIIIPLYENILNISLDNIIKLSQQVNPYIKDLHSYLIFIIIPFNLIKGGVLTTLTYLLNKKLDLNYVKNQ